ncbi:hypothetical protein B0H67DRAFT_322713 [Lasiosphaeris hirsuta]|uniref:Uncharacterized protein n=1 Tax=Lasiosphaeris hirsuta TaxID=260670 RepID=A0AA40A202_9PEZI|nr:hypothetical protein B0H67DRAFT_322713 [Lasiosphaeris hirsuta]
MLTSGSHYLLFTLTHVSSHLAPHVWYCCHCGDDHNPNPSNPQSCRLASQLVTAGFVMEIKRQYQHLAFLLFGDTCLEQAASLHHFSDPHKPTVHQNRLRHHAEETSSLGRHLNHANPTIGNVHCQLTSLPVATVHGSGMFLEPDAPSAFPGAMVKLRRLPVQRSAPDPATRTTGTCIPCSKTKTGCLSSMDRQQGIGELKCWDSTRATASAPSFFAPEVLKIGWERRQDGISVDYWDFTKLDVSKERGRDGGGTMGMDAAQTVIKTTSHDASPKLATLSTSMKSASLPRFMTSLRQRYRWSADANRGLRTTLAVH